MAGVCGRDCRSCTYREEMGCRGCLETEGHPFYGECQVVRCCHGRGKQNCGECRDQADCGWAETMARRRESWKQEEEARQRLREEEERKRKEELRSWVPVLARWLPVLFWLSVVSTVLSLLDELGLSRGIQVALDTVGLLIGLGGLFIYWKFSRLSLRFRSVWRLEIAGEVLALLALALLLGSGTVYELQAGTLEELNGAAVVAMLLTLPTIGIDIAAKYQFCEAMAERSEQLQPELAANWRTLRRCMMGALAALLACLLIMVLIPLLGAMVALGGGLVLVGCSIAELVLLWKSAGFFRALNEELCSAPQ